MELYKNRGFSEFFQDTFTFLKSNGKHFFKHYFIVNGIFLIILMGIGYVFTKFYTDMIFGGLLGGSTSVELDNYINNNSGLFILVVILFVIIGIIAGTVSYVYPAIYLKLYSQNNGKSFDFKTIVNTYKSNIGKLIIFILCSIILAIPLLIALIIGAVALAITIVGILAIPLLFGGFMLFYSMTLMEYLERRRGIWDSFGYSWQLIKIKFWAAVGCVGLFYLISYIAQNVISIIPYIFGMASLFTSLDQGNPTNEEVGAAMTLVMILVFFLTFIVSAILGTITQLNQGIIFYSLKETNENINTKSVIDQIGSSE